MKSLYNVRFLALIQVVHQRDKVCYSNNINAISMMMVNKGKPIDWVDAMFKQLLK